MRAISHNASGCFVNVKNVQVEGIHRRKASASLTRGRQSAAKLKFAKELTAASGRSGREDESMLSESNETGLRACNHCHKEIVMMQGLATKSADDATFANGATYNSDAQLDLAVSADKKAFTALFGNLTLSIDGRASAPIVTRAFSFALPLSGAERGQEIPFFLQGFVFSEKGANAHLMFCVNDQTMAVDFPANSNNSFLQQFKYTVGDAKELRMTVFLAADHDSTSDASVKLNVATIDTDIVKHQRAAGPGT